MRDMYLKSALIMGASLFLGLTLLGYFIGSSVIKFKQFDRTVTVKGLSEKEYPADIALWPIQFSAADNNLTRLYESIEKDADHIVSFLKANGFDDTEINKSPPGIMDKLAQGYEKSRIEFRYSAMQTITVYSKKIEAVRSTMNKIADLGKKGVVLAAQGYQNTTEYLFTRLNEILTECKTVVTVRDYDGTYENDPVAAYAIDVNLYTTAGPQGIGWSTQQQTWFSYGLSGDVY